MAQQKRLTAFKKDIIRLGKKYGKINPQIISNYYDETYWTIKKNFYELEAQKILKRTNPKRLEYEVQQ